MHTLSILRPGQELERRSVARPLVAGGSQADDIHLPGCPPGAVRLVPCAAGVVAEPVACGVRAGGHAISPGGRRLLRAKDRVEIHGSAIALDPLPDGDGTRAVAGALLRGVAAGAAPLAGPHLVVLSGPTAGTRHRLGGEQTVGRGRAATISIPDPRASRVHARIRLGAEGATIEDLRSKNGVRVNGVRIERRPWPIRPGDEVQIGETAIALVGDPPEDGHPLGTPGRLVAAPAARQRLRPGPHAVAAVLLALSAAALALAAR